MWPNCNVLPCVAAGKCTFACGEKAMSRHIGCQPCGCDPGARWHCTDWPDCAFGRTGGGKMEDHGREIGMGGLDSAKSPMGSMPPKWDLVPHPSMGVNITGIGEPGCENHKSR